MTHLLLQDKLTFMTNFMLQHILTDAGHIYSWVTFLLAHGTFSTKLQDTASLHELPYFIDKGIY